MMNHSRHSMVLLFILVISAPLVWASADHDLSITSLLHACQPTIHCFDIYINRHLTGHFIQYKDHIADKFSKQCPGNLDIHVLTANIMENIQHEDIIQENTIIQYRLFFEHDTDCFPSNESIFMIPHASTEWVLQQVKQPYLPGYFTTDVIYSTPSVTLLPSDRYQIARTIVADIPSHVFGMQAYFSLMGEKKFNAWCKEHVLEIAKISPIAMVIASHQDN